MKLPATSPPRRPAADAKPDAPQTEAAPDALFASLLNLTTARTAPAEGQIPDAPLTTPEPPTPKPAEGSPLDALLAALAPVAPAAAPAPKGATPAAPVTPATPPIPAMPAGPTTAALPAAPAHAPAHGDRTAPAGPATPAIAATPTTPAVPATSVVLPATASAPRDARLPAPKDAAPAKAAAPASHAPVADQPPVVDQAAAPKDRPAVRAPEAPRPVLRPERIEALVRVATRQGTAEARIELHPQELGSVVVKLRVTSDGLNATFTAANPDAVAQLQQAGDDLRRLLEAKGITLATLDVRAQSSEARDRREQRGWDRGRERRRTVEHVDDELAAVTTSIPVGELVDVHA
jgi:flagellar hook-length control protein FliK